MKKIAKLFSFLLLLVLFTGCASKDGSKTKPTTSGDTSDTSEKVSTKQGEGLTITIAGDDSADTATLKNTVKVMNVTKNKEMKNGDAFDEGDRISVTLFNCASDVKLRVYTDDFDIFPWFTYEKLTGEDATTGQLPIEFDAEKNINVTYMVDDGEETLTYAKVDLSITATNVDVTISARGTDEDEHTLIDGDTVVVGSTLYYTIVNKSTTDKVIFALYNDNQFDEEAKVIIEPGTTLDEYEGILGDLKVCVEPYVKCSVNINSSLPTGTAVTNYANAEKTSIISSGTEVEKYNYVYPFVLNNSTTDYIAKVTIDGVVVNACRINKNTNHTFDGILLTGNMEVSIITIEGPTVTINSSEKVFLSTGYLLEEGEETILNGDTVPTGLELSVLAIYFSTEYTELRLKITIGGTVVYNKVIPNTDEGIYVNGIYATGNIIISIEEQAD